MVKSILSVYHPGLKDWVIQRVTAVVMVMYTLLLVVFFASHPNLEFPDWHAFFSSYWVKIATMLFIVSLLWHAWIGMWTIFTDYITSSRWRFIMQIAVFLSLLGFFFAGLLIMMSV